MNLFAKHPCKPFMRVTGRVTAFLLVLLFAAAWIGGGQTPLAPEGNARAASQCTFALSATRYLSPASGGSSSVNVITQDNCSWTVVNNTPWIVMISGPNGQGSQPVSFFVQPHSGAPRTGTITIAGITFTVDQAGTLACSYILDPASQSFGAGGGTGVVNVGAPIGCDWGAFSGASWVRINSGTPGIGSGTVSYTVDANTGGPRIATVLIAGQTYNVVQDGVTTCSITIDPASQNFPIGGGAGRVTVRAAANCLWAAVSNVSWVTITSGAFGTGDGEVAFTVAQNSGAARTGTLNISGQLFTITQEGTSSSECEVSISPSTKSFRAGGGIGVISVTAGAACAWSVNTNRPTWIRITTGTTTIGNGVVRFSVAANTTGMRRTGTIFVDDKQFLISQTP